jgi:hypothetical protein
LKTEANFLQRIFLTLFWHIIWFWIYPDLGWVRRTQTFGQWTKQVKLPYTIFCTAWAENFQMREWALKYPLDSIMSMRYPEDAPRDHFLMKKQIEVPWTGQNLPLLPPGVLKPESLARHAFTSLSKRTKTGVYSKCQY